jgi:predicted phosphodiesterase
MVLIQFVSDIHLEYSYPKFNSIINKTDATILILAGDIARYDTKILYDFLKYLSPKFEYIIYISGNHMYYNTNKKNIFTMNMIDKYIKDLCDKFGNIYYTSKNSFILKDIKFICCTLWSNIPENLYNEISNEVNDYRYIYTENGLITPKETTEIHKEHLQFIKNELTSEYPCVIVTHHPMWNHKVSHPDYEGLLTNSSFSNRIPVEDLPHKPKLVISGHTHCNFDINEPGYRLISNQYRREFGKDFNPKLVIEIN